MKSTLVVVTGPTGIGKSAVGLDIAKHFGTEIISADSRQIYREMSIGTAVPGELELEAVTHHFIRCCSIHDHYNAGKYETEVIGLLGKLFERFPVVVMVGGSMLYIDAVLYGIDDLPSADPEIRQYLGYRFNTGGIESLRFELKMLDPEYYSQVDLRNYKRILHALEVWYLTGRRYSELLTNSRKKRNFRVIKTGLTAPRNIIYDRINRRVDRMVEQGLEEEAGRLYPFRDCKALQTVGYKEWPAYFEGSLDRESVIEQIKSNSRRYARKQMTWFSKDPEIHWFDIGEKEKLIPFIESSLLVDPGLEQQDSITTTGPG